MKRIYKLMLASLIGLAFIIGTASLFGAAPTKTPTFDVNVTKVVGQTIYYSFKWTNMSAPVQSYYLEVSYEYYPGGYICLLGDIDNPVHINLARPKTRLGDRATFNSVDPTYTITSGDTVQVRIVLFDGPNGTGNVLGDDNSIYLVP